MGDSISAAHDTLNEFTSWCRRKGYPIPSYDFVNHRPYYKEYDEEKHPWLKKKLTKKTK